jgi:hypothetical protein
MWGMHVGMVVQLNARYKKGDECECVGMKNEKTTDVGILKEQKQNIFLMFMGPTSGVRDRTADGVPAFEEWVRSVGFLANTGSDRGERMLDGRRCDHGEASILIER